jgi:hypothetical protein
LSRACGWWCGTFATGSVHRPFHRFAKAPLLRNEKPLGSRRSPLPARNLVGPKSYCQAAKSSKLSRPHQSTLSACHHGDCARGRMREPRRATPTPGLLILDIGHSKHLKCSVEEASPLWNALDGDDDAVIRLASGLSSQNI